MILINKTSRIFKIIGFQCSTTRLITRNHNLLFKKELSVPTFCNITVNIPFAIELNVLDVHKYHDCDKVFVEVKNCDETAEEPIMIIQEESIVYIKDLVSAQGSLENKICTITAPIKANLNVNSKYGNITLNNFNGDRIVASSDTGNIVVSGFQGKQIDVKTVSGNVKFSGVVQSSLINVLVEKGSVFINKLLGDQTRIETRLGNISVDSSYCNRSTFISEEGDMDLKNIHKHCEVNQKLGITRITCLDGQLDLTQVNGKADIHLSRITEHSQINLSDGHLRLRLSEECQENTKFNIKCKDLNINEDVNFEQIDSNSTLSSSGTESKKKIVYVNCENCSVNVESGSWYDMNSLEKFNSSN